ncbi:MAG TPA: autotransporter-associated beta strand repeat-containing protein, partial [Luteolibacter sp.]|nr:autotransporter-associated beta strand repeat-containing protein [Luteolibacter sp.]
STGVGSVTQNSALSRLSLSGTNTFDGVYTITSGAMSFVNRVSLFNADTAKWTSSKIAVSSGGTLSLGYGGVAKFSAAEISTINNGDILVVGSNLGIDTSDSQTYSNAITDANGGTRSIGFEKLGAGVLTITGNNTYSGDTILSQGSLNVGAAQSGSTGPLSNSTIQFRGGTLQFSAANTFDYSGRISNTSNQAIRIDTNSQTVTFATAFGGTNTTLNKLGTGTLILTAANTYGPASSSTTIFTDVSGGTLRAADGAVYAGDANLKKIFGLGGVQLANSTTLDLRANGQNDNSSQILTYGNQLQVSSTGASYTVNVDRESATGGTGKTIAMGNHNVGANTTLNVTGGNGFQFSIGSYAPGGGGTASTTLLNPTSANLLIGSIGGGTNSASPTVTLGGTSTGNVVTGVIANNGSPGATGTAILKSNTSTWRLNGTNTYTGTTTVNGGKLLINGSTAASSRAVTVNTGGTLGGTGNLFGGTGTSLSAGVTVNAGGTLAPGDLNASIGILRVSSISTAAALTFAPGGTYFWEMAALVDNVGGTAGTDFDQIQMLGANGNLVLGGTSQLTLGFANSIADPNSADPFWQIARSWTIIKAGASTTNTGSTNFNSLTNANFTSGSFSTTADALGNVILNFTPVPEPSSAAIAFGLAGLLGFRRRRG